MTRRLLLIIILLLGASGAGAQVMLKGTVKDTRGEPLAGAAVLETGSNNGVMTDIDGKFSINVEPGKEIEVSFLGFESQTVKVQSDEPVTITLQEAANLVDEVVVVGYGTQKKINLTGSVAQIQGDDIANKTSVNVMSALQGEMPGVVVTQQSGQPGEEGFNLQIRGYSSVNEMAPLVLVDGVEGDLNMLNPNDIASISVLKDAASASIYGSKAAAGVILVTTKQSTGEKISVKYDGSFSFTRSGRKPSRLNSWEEYAITQISNDKPINLEYIEWMKNPNLDAILSSSTQIGYYANTDWIKECLNDWGHMQKHSLSVGGGGKRLNFNASIGYYDHKGFLKYGPDTNSRVNVRLNMYARISQHLDLSINASGAFGQTNSNALKLSALMANIYRCRTQSTLYFPQYEDPVPNTDTYAGQYGNNPVDLLKNAGTNTTRINDFAGQAALRIRNIIPGLHVKFVASRSYRAQLGDRKTNRIIWHSRGEYEYRYSQTDPSSIERTRINTYTDKLQAIIDFGRSFVGNQHNLHVMAGYEWENYVYENVYAKKAYMTNGQYSLNFGSAASAVNTDNIRKSAIMSFFGRANYNYKEKYLVEANLRYDGSSRLAPSNRWGLFPSVSAGWVMSKENFFHDNVWWIDQFKLRGSWGRLGNATALGYYDYINIIQSTGTKALIGGSAVTANYIGTLASPEKTWEIVEVSNVGVDLGFFRNRLTGSFEFFWKRNINMLSAAMGIPSLIGVGLPSSNVGELRTNGWELEMKWRDTIGKRFNWWIGFNLSDSWNRLTKYEGSNVIAEGIVPLLEGYPLNTIWGYRTDGLYQETPATEEAICQPGGALTSAGDLKYINLDDDPYINGGEYTPQSSGDLVCLGSTDPRYTYGINLGLEWKGLSLSVMLQGVGKRVFMLDAETLNPTGGSLYQAISIHRDYWTAENTGAFMPRPVYKGGAYNYKPADRWIQDASYLRIKNIMVSYDIPFKNRKIFKGVNIYVSGDNIWEFSKTWKDFDPEAPAITTVNDWYSFYRAISLGINLSL